MDAGYVFAAGSILVTGEKLTRGQISIDHDAMVNELTAFAKNVAGLPLLRIYWYDGTSTGPTPQHIALANLSNIKVRLGIVNPRGEQKGVDSLIVTDLIDLARNRAMADAVLLSGDEDLRVGVQQAQEFGVRVHLLGIEPCRNNQSPYLVQEADASYEWKKPDLEKFLSRRAGFRFVAPDKESIPAGSEPLEAVADAVAAQVPPEELEAVITTTSQYQLPKEIDIPLLVGASNVLGRDLMHDEKKRLRAAFVNSVKMRYAEIG